LLCYLKTKIMQTLELPPVQIEAQMPDPSLVLAEAHKPMDGAVGVLRQADVMSPPAQQLERPSPKMQREVILPQSRRELAEHGRIDILSPSVVRQTMRAAATIRQAHHS
jgi:hypothetical protein